MTSLMNRYTGISRYKFIAIMEACSLKTNCILYELQQYIYGHQLSEVKLCQSISWRSVYI